MKMLLLWNLKTKERVQHVEKMLVLKKIRIIVELFIVVAVLTSCGERYGDWEPYGETSDVLTIETEFPEYSADVSEIKYTITNNGNDCLSSGREVVLIQKRGRWYYFGPPLVPLMSIQYPPNRSFERKLSTSHLGRKLVRGHYGITLDADNRNEGKKYTAIGEFDVK